MKFFSSGDMISYHERIKERIKAVEFGENIHVTVGILYSVKTRQAPSKSPGGTADRPMGS